MEGEVLTSDLAFRAARKHTCANPEVPLVCDPLWPGRWVQRCFKRHHECVQVIKTLAARGHPWTFFPCTLTSFRKRFSAFVPRFLWAK